MKLAIPESSSFPCIICILSKSSIQLKSVLPFIAARQDGQVLSDWQNRRSSRKYRLEEYGASRNNKCRRLQERRTCGDPCSKRRRLWESVRLHSHVLRISLRETALRNRNEQPQTNPRNSMLRPNYARHATQILLPSRDLRMAGPIAAACPVEQDITLGSLCWPQCLSQEESICFSRMSAGTEQWTCAVTFG